MTNNTDMFKKETENFRRLNKIANANGIVLFGSSFAKDIPVCELKQAFHMDCNIYNRSLDNLSIFDAENFLDDCVIKLSPRKVVLQLGETDLEQGEHTVSEIVNEYEKIIAKLKSADKHCKIVIVSACDNNPCAQSEELNRELESMARRTKCQYADIRSALSNEQPCIKAFSLLRYFMMDKISFCDAIAY